MDLPAGTSLLACCPWRVSGSCGWWLSGWWSCDGSPPDQRQQYTVWISQSDRTDRSMKCLLYFTFNQPDNSVCFRTVLELRPRWSWFYCRDLFSSYSTYVVIFYEDDSSSVLHDLSWESLDSPVSAEELGWSLLLAYGTSSVCVFSNEPP